MNRISILWFNSKKKDILLWDNNNVDILKNAFGNRSFTSLNTRKYLHIAPFYIFKAFVVYFKNFSKTKKCSIRIIYKYKTSYLFEKFILFLRRINYSVNCILSISVVFYFKPKLIISNCDNSIYFQYLDAIVNEFIPVITIQNGNRWHSSLLGNKKNFKHFYNPPGFHSCLAALSEIDIQIYKANGWICDEFHNIGSLGACFNLDKDSIKKKYDICVIANSINSRKSEIKLAELINEFQKKRKLKLCVILKLSINDKNFASHYKEIFDLYGDDAEIIPNNKNINVLCSSEIILGTFSTALREAFSLGKKIYPVNFDYDELNFYMNCLDINLAPNQLEFNSQMENYLNLDNYSYVKKYKKQRQLIGSFPQNVRPTKRLLNLINQKSNL